MSERGLETVNIFNEIISLVIKSIEKSGDEGTQADQGAGPAPQAFRKHEGLEGRARRGMITGLSSEPRRLTSPRAEEAPQRTGVRPTPTVSDAERLARWGGPGHP
tara:strand:- start:3211 stop:3525 length:315 start_codon:yes stop_codon:yes gene_type:complete